MYLCQHVLSFLALHKMCMVLHVWGYFPFLNCCSFVYGFTGNCTFGDVRLMGGKDDNEGRVEVCMRGLWGTICDNHWGVFEATVVCKQLGIEGSKSMNELYFT